jgi:excisionase family DNA binding protein
MTGQGEYLRARDIARLTGMSVRTARRWIAKRILASGKIGGARLVARRELERLLSPPIHLGEPDLGDGNE